MKKIKMNKEKIIKDIWLGRIGSEVNQLNIRNEGEFQGVDANLTYLRNVDGNIIPEAFRKPEILNSIFSCSKPHTDEYSNAIKSMNFGRNIIKIVGNANLCELKFKNLQQMINENKLLDLEIEEELKFSKQIPDMTKNWEC